MDTSGEKPWEEEIERLLDDQKTRLDLLSKVLKSFPRSTLYNDEEISKNEEYCFAAFIQYVKISLAKSPRTVLRHAVNKALFELCSTKPKIMSELCDILDIECHKYCEKIDIKTFVSQVHDFPRGNTYRRLVAAQTKSKEGSPWIINPMKMRSRVEKGLYAKAKKQHRPPPPKDVVDALINDCIEKDKQSRACLEEKVEALKLQLDSDDEYLRFLRVSHLWEISGIQKLWDDYVRADKSEGHERRERGSRFECEGARICFQMIVRKLQMPIDECWYVKGANWYNRHHGKIQGEIDLVVMNKDNNEIIAICELKSGCFEIAPAFAQHEGKLAKAAPFPANNRNPQFQIIADVGGGSKTVLPLPKGRSVHLFVATILPDETRPVLGVEPAMCKAICDGIRNQGYLIRDGTTNSNVTSKNLATLFKSGLFRCNQQNHIYPHYGTTVKPPNFYSTEQPIDAEINSEIGFYKQVNEGQSKTPADGIDLSVLKSYIRQRVRLDESPVGCLERCSSNLLMLKDGDFEL